MPYTGTAWFAVCVAERYGGLRGASRQFIWRGEVYPITCWAFFSGR
ncbi:MAG: hypothetical protein NTZ69_16515 [Bacteroidia bacterium]|nr:hypothetical protein [Bacteroidia bacterium]